MALCVGAMIESPSLEASRRRAIAACGKACFPTYRGGQLLGAAHKPSLGDDLAFARRQMVPDPSQARGGSGAPEGRH
jgi:hypothetical protein